jgi:predicted nucleic acid-binding protein
MRRGRHMNRTVVKIDFCKSKRYAAQREQVNPQIRADALKRLVEVSRECFPQGDTEFPDGSFYKAEGDAVYYVLAKPSVALRGSMEFMQSWFHLGLVEWPECRVVLDVGHVDAVQVPGKYELTGKVFETISMLEKGVGDGQIFLTESALGAIDSTMAKFTLYAVVHPGTPNQSKVYSVDFLDPRTTPDSSLIHALFVAHPMAAEARNRVFEIFILEYLLEAREPADYQAILEWGVSKGYTLPPRQHLHEVVANSKLVEEAGDGVVRFTDGAEAVVLDARRQFSAAKEECVAKVAETIERQLGRSNPTSGLDLSALVEDYLCALFSEIRMMANYFRSTLHLFNTGPDQFSKYDHIIRRHLPEKWVPYFEDWRNAFIEGLRLCCEGNSIYIAGVFHNVLAAYYLNRTAMASPYQTDLLRKRRIYLDTNVLYSLMTRASQYNELVHYIFDRMHNIGVPVYVLPLTLQEYEDSLLFVQAGWDKNGPKDFIVARNPWLYQEFVANRALYLDSIAVCREHHSLAKDKQITPDNFDALDEALAIRGLRLEREYALIPDDVVEEMWSGLRNHMTSNAWDMREYWEFVNRDFPQSVKRHDMTCLADLSGKADRAKADALGPRVLFVTVDSKIYRLRKQFPFVVTPEQLVEFILPYLFLSDVPLVDADTFPNRLLSAQLGTLLAQRPPALVDVVGAYFRSPELANANAKEVFFGLSESTARVLNSERFRSLVQSADQCPAEARLDIAGEAADLLADLMAERRAMEEEREVAARLRQDNMDLQQSYEAQLAELRKKVSKLQSTVGYWRSEAKKK